ncbi:MAG: protein kinase [Planctomycetes bacterium]|nr:protein kinase [Planctomycetota bacterium]
MTEKPRDHVKAPSGGAGREGEVEDGFLDAVRGVRAGQASETLPERPPMALPADRREKTAWLDRDEVSSQAAALAGEVSRAGADPANRFGRYILLSLLGAGGMGVVHRAWDTVLSRVVALKRLLEDPQNPSPNLRERFLREGRSAARLKSPGIVGIHDVGEVGGRPYLTMDHVEGETLDAHMIATGEQRERGQPEAFARQRQEIAILAQVAEAVGFAHASGIVHRDLKPGNVLLDRQGKPFVVDFGLAKDLLRSVGGTPHESLTIDGAVLGTPVYMSPEQALGRSSVGPASDVFSLGVILYRMLVGCLPFEGEAFASLLSAITQTDPVPPRLISTRLSRDVESICLKCLEKDPPRRYPNGAAFAADLRRYLAGEPVEARPVSRLRIFGRWCRRHPAAVVAVSFAIALGATAAGVWMHQEARAREDLRTVAEIAELGAEARGAWRAGNQDRLRESLAAVEERSERILARNPEAGEVYLERGRLRLLGAGLVNGGFEGARADLDRAVELLGPGERRAHAARGRLRLALYQRRLEETRLLIPDPDEAAGATAADLELADPELAPLREDAERDLSLATGSTEETPEQALIEGYLALARKDWDEVIGAADRALQFDAFAEAHWLRGVALLERGDFVAAREAMHDAVRVGRGFADAWLGWAEARKAAVDQVHYDRVEEYTKGGGSLEAVEALRAEVEGAIQAAYRAMDLGADPNRIGRVLGELSWALGEILRKASYRSPNWDVRALLAPHLAALETIQSRFQDARFLYRLAQLQECYAIVESAEPHDPRAELEKAIELYAEAIRRKPAFRNAYYWRGNAGYELGLARREWGGSTSDLSDARAALAAAIDDYTKHIELPNVEGLSEEQSNTYWALLYRALSRFTAAECARAQGPIPLDEYRATLEALESFGEKEDEALIPKATCRIALASTRIERGGEWTAGEIDEVRGLLDRAEADTSRSLENAVTERDRWIDYGLQGRIFLARAELAHQLGENPTTDCQLAILKFRSGEKAGPVWSHLWTAKALALLARARTAAGGTGESELRAALAELARCPLVVSPAALADVGEGLPLLFEVAAWTARAPADPEFAPDSLAFARLAAAMAAVRTDPVLRDLAFEALRGAGRHGRPDWDALAQGDPNLRALQADPRWRELTGR